MGFSLQTKKKDPSTRGRIVFDASIRGMDMMVRALLMIGAIDAGKKRGEGWPEVDGAPPRSKLESNSGEHVTADECKVVAKTIRSACRKGSHGWESLAFFCDAEFGDEASPKAFAELLRGLRAFAQFNARAAKLDGYTVD
jgi:hypothetical protein